MEHSHRMCYVPEKRATYTIHNKLLVYCINNNNTMARLLWLHYIHIIPSEFRPRIRITHTLTATSRVRKTTTDFSIQLVFFLLLRFSCFCFRASVFRCDSDSFKIGVLPQQLMYLHYVYSNNDNNNKNNNTHNNNRSEHTMRSSNDRNRLNERK